MARSPRKQHTDPSADAEPKEIVSIADLARHLNLSAWTVSRAINGHPEVNPKTKERIFSAMDQLGFRPNLFARALRGRGTGLIGVCFAGLGNPILNTKLYHLQEYLHQRHLRILMEVSLRDPKNEARVVEDFRKIRVDGLVLIYSGLSPSSSRRLLKGLACVHVDPHEIHRSPSISLDRRKAMKLLFDHLYGLGHRSFGLLGIGKYDAWRWPALCAAAEPHDLDPQKAFSIFGTAPTGEESIETGRELARKALGMPMRPTALMCVDDRVATGAIQAVLDAGLRVPEDISVTGFDNLDIARQLRPTLTTIEQNPLQLMQRAGALLMEQIALPVAERGAPQEQTVEPSLVIGTSSGPAPVPV